MFNNKLKVVQKDGKLRARIVIGGIGVVSSEVIGSDPAQARAKVVRGIMDAAEFFPLKKLIGDQSFAKATQLFNALASGSAAQKKEASSTLRSILANARKANPDPTAQDIEYAVARFIREHKEKTFNKDGDFVFDGLGFSPAILRKNLDAIAATSRPMAEAKKLFDDIALGNAATKKRAIDKLKIIKHRTKMGNDKAVGREILGGVSQYMKANNASFKREALFGDENVTVGFSFKKLGKKIKKSAKAVKKNPLKAVASAAMGPVRALPAVARAIKKNPIKALAIVALGPLSVPLLMTKQGKAALGVTSKAKRGDKKSIAKIRAVNAMAKTGNPQAVKAMQSIKMANKAVDKLPAEVIEEMEKPTSQQQYGPGSQQKYGPSEEDESFAEDAEETETEVEEEKEEEVDAESFTEDETDEIIVGAALDDENHELVGKFNFSKTMKKTGGLVKPLAKLAMPLAVKAANTFAPGSGNLISMAMPSLIDSIPGKERPELAQIARGMGLIKAVDEMQPGALEKVNTIKKLASQGVPDAVVALNALKVAKGTQQIAETIVMAKKEAAEGSSQEPLPVRIVAWGK
jgi:hypothetical protein